MQEEAIRRAREMQSRARIPRQNPGNRRPVQHGQEPAAPEPPAPEPAPPPPEEPQEQEAPPAQNMPQASADTPGTLLDSLFQDKERTIILALLILLSGDGGHHELMFALMFLLM